MSVFKKLRKRIIRKNAVGLTLGERCQIFKMRIAKYLQQKTEPLSPAIKKLSLLFFCLLFGGISIEIIIHAATAERQWISVTKISKTVPSIQFEKNYLQEDSSINKEEYKRVEKFKNYLFQLKSDSVTHNKFDSIIQARPRLLDSIYLFEKMYLQQK